MKPKILITPSWEKDCYRLKSSYCEIVSLLGGIPLILPYRVKEDVNEVISIADGIILTGGNDPDPLLFGEEPVPELGKIEPLRDKLEVSLVEKAVQKNIPLLGICKGFQILNLALGGNIIQDINREVNENIKHMQEAPKYHPTHSIYTKNNKIANEIFSGSKQLKVNSFHHQGIREVTDPLKALAESPDGLIEMASDEEGNLLGVQWHPEKLNDFTAGKNIFEYFIEHILRKR